jgi:FkbM family methyltransferase
MLEQCYSELLEPGQTVFDIGAHAGMHLDRFVELVGPQGHTFAFEPIPGLARLLAHRYRENSSVTVKPIALSNWAGKTTFQIVENGLPQSGLKRRDYGADSVVLKLPSNRIVAAILRRLAHAFGRFSLARRAFERGWIIVREVEVEVDTIDAQAQGLSRVDYLKIDVEGAELDCLRGGQQTVARHRPFISLEYGRSSYAAYGETTLGLFKWSQENRYLVSDLFGNIVEDEREWLDVCDVSYWDFFLLPIERRDFWTTKFSSFGHVLINPVP